MLSGKSQERIKTKIIIEMKANMKDVQTVEDTLRNIKYRNIKSK